MLTSIVVNEIRVYALFREAPSTLIRFSGPYIIHQFFLCFLVIEFFVFFGARIGPLTVLRSKLEQNLTNTMSTTLHLRLVTLTLSVSW